jgi:large subunit ribosomal protein L31e
MAEKKSEVTLERVYNIPLRRVWVKVSRITRANRSVSEVRNFVKRHTKAKEVKVSQNVNSLIWASGIKKPPGMITVKVKVEAGIASVRLPDEITLEEEKKKFLEKKGAKKEEVKAEEAAAPAAEEAKAETKAKEEPVAEEKKAAVKEEKEKQKKPAAPKKAKAEKK